MNKNYVFLFAIGLIGLGMFTSYVSTYNYAAAAEKQIVAEYDDMKNILGQYSLKVSEAAQVPTMYRDDLSKVFSEAVQGRYGKDGSKAVFQFLKEQNPNLDPKLYQNIQQIIEAGRNKFENKQTHFIDVKRQYETNLSYFWKGTLLKFAGFPKINLAEYNIIQSQHGQQTFESGIDTGVKLR